jgi:voltage-gated potassium channel
VDRESIEKKWNQVTGIPLLVLSIIFLAFYAAPIINPDIEPALVLTFETAQTIIWLIFVIDFVGRFILAPKKLIFIRHNLIELLAVILPMLRPLRALRLLSVVTIGLRRVGGKLRNRVALYVSGAAFMLWFIAGLAVTEAERGVEGSNIENVTQGWWWAFITLATVGYGDKYPVTPEGQWVAVVIVLTGIALLGTVSAVLASWFVESVKETENTILKDTDETNTIAAELLDEVKQLRKENQQIQTQLSDLTKQTNGE